MVALHNFLHNSNQLKLEMLLFVHEEFIYRLTCISDICLCGINILQRGSLYLPEGAACLFSGYDSTQKFTI